MTLVKPNANFYSLAGTSVHENQNPEYKEYRRRWTEYPLKFTLRDFPMHLDIEATSRCNIKCTFCDKLPLLKKEDLGDMNFRLYKKIVDEAAERGLWGIKLSYRGEPLLHKSIVDMVTYAKRKEILDVYFNTNAVLLNGLMSERLIDAGLDRISISVEGIDPYIFEKNHKGAKFEIILRNIDTLMKLREKKGVAHPRVRIQTIYLKDLSYDDYVKFWASRCDEVAGVDYKDTLNRREGMTYNWACPQLWQRMTIGWDGIISPCNNDDLRLLAVGNIKEKTVYQCWHDKKAEEARESHRNSQSHKVAACDGCPWRTAQIEKLKINPLRKIP